MSSVSEIYMAARAFSSFCKFIHLSFHPCFEVWVVGSWLTGIADFMFQELCKIEHNALWAACNSDKQSSSIGLLKWKQIVMAIKAFLSSYIICKLCSSSSIHIFNTDTLTAELWLSNFIFENTEVQQGSILTGFEWKNSFIHLRRCQHHCLL